MWAGPVDFFENLGDAIKAKSNPHRPKVPGVDLKARSRRFPAPDLHSGTQGVVDRFLEGPSGAPRFGGQPGGNVLIERQSCSHIVMLL
jgi:hypothetical protein